MPATTTVKPPGSEPGAVTGNAVRPLSFAVPDAYLEDLRQRLAVTRWPSRETVDDESQGVRREKLQDLVEYWRDEYDWRRAEAKLNACPSTSPRSTASTSSSPTSASRTTTRCR